MVPKHEKRLKCYFPSYRLQEKRSCYLGSNRSSGMGYVRLSIVNLT